MSRNLLRNRLHGHAEPMRDLLRLLPELVRGQDAQHHRRIGEQPAHDSSTSVIGSAVAPGQSSSVSTYNCWVRSTAASRSCFVQPVVGIGSCTSTSTVPERAVFAARHISSPALRMTIGT